MRYNTKQQKAVLSCLEKGRGASVTACELMERLRGEGFPVGLTTVYRQLEKLEMQGLIHRITTDEGSFYQYCDHPEQGDCFLLKCERCGRLEHLDCSHLKSLYDHLAEEHRFIINPRKTLFYGLCEICSQKEDAE
ncbi:MAG: transcriptional repressor [Clostridiales bacterium]|nr:transcriptional repressor [Clostridiales bacterium]